MSEIVAAYWQAMNGNDWAAVAARFLAPDFTCIWPQSAEIICGRDDFVRVNAGFPGQGGWRFEIVSMIADGDRCASDCRITQPDLEITARAVTFHEIGSAGLIQRQTEFWPDPFPVPEWRRGLLATDPERARF